ncbi:hypothetical protein [Kingella potus]|uniref:hypothetical protein n=1 Tax=Kingella potus TaxID=265175 RepID=UPI001FD153B4|nr:hypothetical protein [Kingella potus]UOP01679.1 hypothetical protein LVJ84_05950 [Kingella potus]
MWRSHARGFRIVAKQRTRASLCGTRYISGRGRLKPLFNAFQTACSASEAV